MATVTETDQKVITLLARAFYMHYVRERKFNNPHAYPWSPRWALDYARIAVDSLGYEDAAVEDLAHHVGAP